MKRPQRGADGKYTIGGKKYPKLFGSRKEVFSFGTAYKTAGNLTKNDLIFNNKTRRIVSKKKHISEKKNKRLEKAGYFAQKGKFGYVRRTPRKTRGGNNEETKPSDNKTETKQSALNWNALATLTKPSTNENGNPLHPEIQQQLLARNPDKNELPTQGGKKTRKHRR
jgi:hypothetical protein